ncbi:MAG: hypothetical protein H6968_11490 [Chromatiaceae bacterium]|nr:hypothetical protein [Chromatiaceae bacterium]
MKYNPEMLNRQSMRVQKYDTFVRDFYNDSETIQKSFKKWLGDTIFGVTYQ